MVNRLGVANVRRSYCDGGQGLNGLNYLRHTSRTGHPFKLSRVDRVAFASATCISSTNHGLQHQVRSSSIEITEQLNSC